MKTSVVIPAHNCERTIRATIDSVLCQTAPPDEILVMDDGSTDNTASILNSYKPRITVFWQENGGVASARNTLCERAQGNLIAFLDSDDIWHPRYLAAQRELFRAYPTAVGFFTGHVNFRGYGPFEWNGTPPELPNTVEVLEPPNFVMRYNTATGPFASMSYCCVPTRVLEELGKEPFHPALSGVDDSYLCTELPLLGPVVYAPAPLVAYRQTSQAQSVNRLKMFGLWVEVFELLNGRYRALAGAELRGAFRFSFAIKRRCYGKVLMGAGRSSDARRQFRLAATESCNAVSIAKSLSLLLSTYMPAALQPAWSPSHRE